MSDSLRPHGLQPTRVLHPWDFPGKSTGVGCHCLLHPFYVVSTNYRVLIYCTCHFQDCFLCFIFFCLLVSSVSDFHPDTRGAVVDTFFFFLSSLVQSRCGEGGMLQTNNTGVCLQCLSHTGPAPRSRRTQLRSRLLRWEPSEAGLGLHAPPRSKPRRLRHSGSPQRCRLSWACVLCPSQAE